MLSRTVVLIALTCLTSQLYTKKHSALVDNGVYFYRRMDYKMSVNPLFYNANKQFMSGVCSSKAGPRCLVKNPTQSFTHNPLLGKMTPDQALIYAKADLNGAAQAPYMEMYMREQQRNLIFIASEPMKELDKMLQAYYE